MIYMRLIEHIVVFDYYNYAATILLQVGVHIADVSFFVSPGIELDKWAQRRATSTYLVHKVPTHTINIIALLVVVVVVVVHTL